MAFILACMLCICSQQIDARCHMGADGNVSQAFTISTLMGRRDEPMYHVFARSLAEAIAHDGMGQPDLD